MDQLGLSTLWDGFDTAFGATKRNDYKSHRHVNTRFIISAVENERGVTLQNEQYVSPTIRVRDSNKKEIARLFPLKVRSPVC